MRIVEPALLKMEGRSGCKLEVLSTDGILSVRKISKESGYNTRLLLQAAKQQIFFKKPWSAEFKTPQVVGQSNAQESLTWFEMPYLHGQKYSEFFERASIQDVRNLALKFERHFMLGLANSKIEAVDPGIFLSKLEAVYGLLPGRPDVDQRLIKLVVDYLEKVPGGFIPINSCHGDFTFSNMIFCEDAIYLVDFLDSFVESPLLDLVKFRQDTFFYWSLLIENQLPDNRSAKVTQIFNYLDEQVYGKLVDNKFVKEWYTYLQVFNLLRILPYVSDKKEIDFVQKNIQRIIPTA
jgi:hypothetical protein